MRSILFLFAFVAFVHVDCRVINNKFEDQPGVLINVPKLPTEIDDFLPIARAKREASVFSQKSRGGNKKNSVFDYIPKVDIGTGSIVLKVDKPLTGPGSHDPSVDLAYKHKVYDGEHGHVTLGAGAEKRPGQDINSHVSLEAAFEFGK